MAYQLGSDHLVRVRRPKVILFAFHGTISPTDWEDQCIFPYVQTHLLSYLKSQWTVNMELRSMIEQLREQSFNEHFVFETSEAPLVIAFDQTNSNWETVLKSVNDYVLYDLAKIRSSQTSILLVRNCWIEGYEKKEIKTM